MDDTRGKSQSMTDNFDQPEAALASSGIQTRSFGGCNTCRRRRVKCDETRPSCGPCRKSALQCEGYSKSIVFHFQDGCGSGSENGGNRFRRPLFSEAARRDMSEQLTSSVSSRSLLSQINQLNDESQSLSVEAQVNIKRGPFGVFRGAQDQPHTVDESWGEDGSNVDTLTMSALGADNPEPVSFQDESSTRPFGGFSPSDFLSTLPMDSFVSSILDASNTDLLEHFGDIAESTLFLDAPIEHGSQVARLERGLSPPADRDIQHDQLLEVTTNVNQDSMPQPSTLEALSSNRKSDHDDAVILLQYFSSTVVSYVTPIRHEKTPWNVLFLPYVRNCLALLTLDQPVDHAGMCTFNGMLAISALSMGGAHRSTTWLEKGETYKHRAHQHCEMMLRSAYDLPKRYKYKSVLMALQIMTIMSTLGGDPVTEEYHFLEAEKFIKLRGLGRKSSRKVRLLHHFYAFERLLYESTCMRGIDFKHRHRVCNDIKSVSVVPYPEDNMAFRRPNWHNLDEEIMKASSPEESDPDLEDEILGLWPDALHSKVFGWPEHWILIILHVVLLGKEKDAVEQSGSSGNISLEEFLKRASTLEACINQHVMQPNHPSIRLDRPSTDCQSDVLENILDAIRHALQIFFYRRIYEVSTSWLQDKVVHVRDCLLRCETADPAFQLSGCVGLLWASFVASCEAESPQVQKSFASWYERAAQRTGMACWINSLNLSEQLWSEKCRSRGTKLTWIDILRRHQRQRIRACASAA